MDLFLMHCILCLREGKAVDEEKEKVKEEEGLRCMLSA
jgi:hypothetical protein